MSQYFQSRIGRIITKKVPVVRPRPAPAPAAERAYVFIDEEPTRVVPQAEFLAKLADERARAAG